MDAVSYSLASKQAQRIEKFIENPDSTSGIVTVPKTIASGETVTVPAGRVAVLPNVVVEGDLVVEAGGEIFVPAGANFSDLEGQITAKVTKQDANITVNVGAGQTYTTINQALEYLSGFYPMYKKSGVTATINLKAGFIMAEQVLVSGIDLGWITIVGEDAETIITHTALTTAFGGDNYPAFGVDKSGTSPVIGQLFRFNVEKVGGNKHGLMALGAGSSANVLSGKGFIGAGTHGIVAQTGSTISANGANCSNAGTHGILAQTGSIISANGAIIQNQTTGSARIAVQFGGSHISANGVITTGGTVPVLNQTANTLTANGIIYQ